MTKYHKKLLALGCPKSGSRFLTAVLRGAGVKVGHEMFKRDGTVGMYFAVEDVWYPGKHWTTDEEHPVEDETKTRRSNFVFDKVFHFVRDPRMCIPSIGSTQFAPFNWCWQERHTGISCGMYPKRLRAMKFWVAWNELIEKNEKIDLFFRVEDIDDVWPEICEQLGITDHAEVPPIPRDTGHDETGPRENKGMTWDEMKALNEVTYLRVREMAARYGYED